MSTKKEHPIAVVVHKTGLSVHVIRKWEERYSVVQPGRTSGGRRLYSDDDIHKLFLIGKALKVGYSISQLAVFSIDELQKIVADNSIKQEADVLSENKLHTNTMEQNIQSCLACVVDLDEVTLRKRFTQSTVIYNQIVMIDQFIPSFMNKIGLGWQNGEIRISQEHLASEVIKSYLSHVYNNTEIPDNAPGVVVATMANQNHSIAAYSTAVIAANLGWKTLFLGANVPSEEIAAAVLLKHAKLVLLSFSYPFEQASVITELNFLQSILPAKTSFIIGGTPTGLMDSESLNKNIIIMSDFSELRNTLQKFQ